MESYDTLDNGSNPFRVEIDSTFHLVKIFQRKYTPEHFVDYSKTERVESFHELMTVNFEHVFVGKSPLCKMTETIKTYGEKFDGNSILVKIDKFNYVFIGHEITRFSTELQDDEIIDYTSTVGNNYVPYPTAFGKKCVYMMVDHTRVEKSFLHTVGPCQCCITVDNSQAWRTNSTQWTRWGSLCPKLSKPNDCQCWFIDTRVETSSSFPCKDETRLETY